MPSSRRVRLAAAAGGLVAAAALLLVDPTTSSLFPDCPFRLWTGAHCPGCGTARAFHALLNGRVGAALGANPLAVLVAPFMAYLGVRWLVAPWRREESPQPELPPALARLVPIVVVAFWVLRNTEAFAFLAPGGVR